MYHFSKHGKNKPNPFFRTHLIRYLKEFNYVENNPFKIHNININLHNEIRAEIFYNKKLFAFSYMDKIVTMRKLCTILAEDFRDIAGKSVFFDIRKGKLICIT